MRNEQEIRPGHPVCDDMEGRYCDIFDNFWGKIDSQGVIKVDDNVLAEIAYSSIVDLNKFVQSKPDTFPGLAFVKNPMDDANLINLIGYRNALYLDENNIVYAGSYRNNMLFVLRKVKEGFQEEFAQTLRSFYSSLNEVRIKSFL